MTLILTLKHTISPILVSKSNLHKIHIVIIKYNQVIIENDLQLDINAKPELNHKTKIRNEFLDSIMYRKVVSI